MHKQNGDQVSLSLEIRAHYCNFRNWVALNLEITYTVGHTNLQNQITLNSEIS